MVELETEGEQTRTEVATFLREFADELDGGMSAGLDDERAGMDRERLSDENRVGGAEVNGSRDAKRMTFIVGGDSATVTVPNTVEFEVEVESRSPMVSNNVEQSIELELSWKIDDSERQTDDEEMHIE